MGKFLVEVGANDGIIVSKSRKLILQGWSGLMIEPIKFYFEKLSDLYKNNDNIELLNVAVSNKKGHATMYRIKTSYLSNSHYGHGVNSFNRDHPGIKRLEKEFGIDGVLEETVQTFPLSKIFKERNIEEIDLLIIDTEGSDYQVIKSIDFDNCMPKKIIYENKHLGEVNDTCETFLKDLGYTLERKGSDTYCELISLKNKILFWW